MKEKPTRAAPGQLGPLQRETLPACPEDPTDSCPCFPHPPPSLLSSPPFWTHCDLSYLFFGFLVVRCVDLLFICRTSDIFVKHKLYALKGLWATPPCPTSSPLLLCFLCRRADIKPKTRAGRARAQRLVADKPHAWSWPLSILPRGLSAKPRLTGLALARTTASFQKTSK